MHAERGVFLVHQKPAEYPPGGAWSLTDGRGGVSSPLPGFGLLALLALSLRLLLGDVPPVFATEEITSVTAVVAAATHAYCSGIGI